MKTRKKYFVVFYILCFIFMGCLGLWMPKLGDDWNWWSGWGTSYFSSGNFLNYDGRYLGDFLIITIMHNYALRALLYGSTIVLILYLADEITEKLVKTDYSYPLASMMMFIGLLFLPKDIFQQTLGWSSGFVNYVVSVVYPLVVLYLIITAFKNKVFDVSKKIYFLFFIASIFAQFMAEHITIFNIGILLVTIFMFRFYSSSANNLFKAGFLGNIIGAMLMFSNKAYLRVFFHEDNYRSASNISKFWLTNYIDQRIHISIIIFMLAVVACTIYAFYLFEKNRMKFITLVLTLLGIWIYPSLTLINNRYIISDKRIALAVVIFLFAVTFLILKQRNTKQKLVDLYLFWGSIILILPFMVVKPFGPRCTFMSSIFLMLLMIIKIVQVIKKSPQTYKLISILLVIVCIVSGVNFLTIVYNYHITETTSEKFLAYQRKENVPVYYFLDYKDPQYMWIAAPIGNDAVTKIYMTRHGLKSKTVLLGYNDWMKVRNANLNNPKKMYIELLKLKPIKKFY